MTTIYISFFNIYIYNRSIIIIFKIALRKINYITYTLIILRILLEYILSDTKNYAINQKGDN